jgi:translation initiation factor 6 (eIF-6)
MNLHSENEAELNEIAETLNALSDKILYSNNDAEVKAALIKRYEELMPQKLKLESKLKVKDNLIPSKTK